MPTLCRSLAVGVLLAGGVVLDGATAATSGAVSPDLVISQVYGGGGNSGATFTNDFVELANRGETAVDVTGWSVQYASAAGVTWQVTRLSGTVPAGGRLLVQEAAGAGGTQPLPAPGVIGTIPMSATAGKVALVTSQSALACGANCASAPGVRDFVGYGGANDAEGGHPAPTLSNTTAALRGGGGLVDTDDNAADFSSGPPAPGGSTDPGGESGLRIHDLQGAAHLSPKAGVRALDVPGVVTAVSGNLFWIQDPEPDADPATSEGITVFTSTRPTVEVGAAVTVSGTVTEFRPGGAGSTNLTTTELTNPTVTATGPGPVPPATLVGPGGRVPPDEVIDDDATGSVEDSGAFDATGDGIDFWESMEGMLVELRDAQAVGPTNGFGELPVVTGAASVRTARGGIAVSPTDFNPERLLLDDVLAAVPAADTGDTLPGPVTGVLDYSFGNPKLEILATPQVSAGGLVAESTRPARGRELAVATFNVENLSPADPPEKVARLAGVIVHNLAAPGLIAVEEIQDNTGPTDDGVVAADQTLAELATAIEAAGGPRYSWRQIDPVDGQDGGQPGGNIRVAFLFRTDRGLSFVDRPGGDATTPTAVLARHGTPRLSLSPGRIEPANPAFDDSRKPLAGEFRFRGHPLFVVANHFASKSGDQPLFGRFQPPVRSSEAQRHEQARAVSRFVGDVLAVDRRASVVVLGDLNDFEFSETTDLLVGDGELVDLPRTLPVPERYTFVFDGNSQVLDHIMLSPGLAARGRFDYDIVHVNSEFTDQASDHDPQVVRLDRVR